MLRGIDFWDHSHILFQNNFAVISYLLLGIFVSCFPVNLVVFATWNVFIYFSSTKDNLQFFSVFKTHCFYIVFGAMG